MKVKQAQSCNETNKIFLEKISVQVTELQTSECKCNNLLLSKDFQNQSVNLSVFL